MAHHSSKNNKLNCIPETIILKIVRSQRWDKALTEELIDLELNALVIKPYVSRNEEAKVRSISEHEFVTISPRFGVNVESMLQVSVERLVSRLGSRLKRSCE